MTVMKTKMNLKETKIPSGTYGGKKAVPYPVAS